jgi:hypothetical protein
MKHTEETLAFIDKLRAKGVTRVEFSGDDISALDFGPTPDDGEQNTTAEASQVAAPYEAAIKQMHAGRFQRGTS